ncbi:MAG TPA: PhoU domain-containing protein [Acidimicrobiales bacterium]|nr:PhoU domain-containing protein [Acidimicrobiales bacterium]
MASEDDLAGLLDREVVRLFSLVSEAVAGATDALLSGEALAGRRIVAADESVDELTRELSERIWHEVEQLAPAGAELRRLVGLLLILPELERSADLAEHIAQRAVNHLGPEMSPVSRGVVQRMSEVAIKMWREVAEGYLFGGALSASLDEADEELDILHGRLTSEVATSTMPSSIGAQVTLLARFYERLGDHAVNLARRIEVLDRGP